MEANSGSSEIIYLYLAENFIKTQTHFDDDEVIELEYVPLDKVVKMIENNEIKDAKTIIAITRYLIKNKSL